LMLII